MEMRESAGHASIIEIKLEDVSSEEVENLEETKYPIEVTPEHDEINIKPEFQVHVAVLSQDENITDTGPEMYSPIELTSFKIETQENQQIEVKTEFEWLKANTNTEDNNTDYEQSTKAEIEEVNAEYYQAETDQSRSDRMSLEQTELNQHQEEFTGSPEHYAQDFSLARYHIKQNDEKTSHKELVVPHPELLNREKKQAKKKRHRCTQCSKAFRTPNELKIHTRIHTGEKPYQCEHCKKAFAQLSSLITHQKLHTGEKLNKCNECNKRFAQSSALMRHQRRIHRGEKRCDKCRKEFRSSKYLTLHQRSHTEKKSHQCDICMKCFKFLSLLARHQITHTGARPYKCNRCEKDYTDKSSLTRHKKTHTNEKSDSHKYTDCKKVFSSSTCLEVPPNGPHKRKPF